MYQSVGANDDLIVTDGSAWLWDGCGLPDGDHAARRRPGRVRPLRARRCPGPTNVDVLRPLAGARPGQLVGHHLLHAPPAAAGSLATGMASWVFKLSNTTEFPSNIVPAAIPGITEVLLRAMENVYGTFGAGPASGHEPSGGNWSQIYSGAAAGRPSAQGTNAA